MNTIAEKLTLQKMIHSSYDLLSRNMDYSLVLGITALVIAFIGVIIAGLNLYINELNRRMASFRLAFDLKNFRDERERKMELDATYKQFAIS